MSQSRKLSLIESLTNVAVGFGISLASQIVIFSGYGVKLPLLDNIAITVWFTLISIARSYLLRRAFNRVPGAPTRAPYREGRNCVPPRVIIEGRRVLTPAESEAWLRERFDREGA